MTSRKGAIRGRQSSVVSQATTKVKGKVTQGLKSAPGFLCCLLNACRKVTTESGGNAQWSSNGYFNKILEIS